LEAVALLLVIAGASRAQAACPSTAADVLQAVNAAEASFSAMDAGSFGTARDQALTLLSCLTEPLAPMDAAALHRVEGFAAFLAMDEPGALASFTPAVRLQPGYALPSTIAPEGSPLASLYRAASSASVGEPGPLFAAGVQVRVDGLAATALHPSQAAVLQVLGADGAVSWSGYLHAAQEPPAILFTALEVPAAPLAVLPLPEPVKHRKVGRLVALSSSVAAAGVLGGFALDAWGDYRQAQTECSTRTAEDVCSQATLELKNHNHDKAIGLGAAAGGAAALGLGLGVSLAF
jgi:hypothetical protein